MWQGFFVRNCSQSRVVGGFYKKETSIHNEVSNSIK
jgi:hypothetical protein